MRSTRPPGPGLGWDLAIDRKSRSVVPPSLAQGSLRAFVQQPLVNAAVCVSPGTVPVSAIAGLDPDASFCENSHTALVSWSLAARR